MKLTTTFFPLVAAMALANAAWAQTPPDAGQLLQEQRRAPELPAPSPALSIEAPAIQPTAPGGPQIGVRQVLFNGNTVFSQDELQTVLGDLTGSAYDLAGLRNLADRITLHYRNNGYPFARAYLPAQPADTGTIRIEILEGRYGRVQAAGAADVAAAAQPYLQALQPGTVIDSHTLERTTLIMSDLPGVEIYPVIKPGTVTGSGDLDVRVEKNPGWRGSVALDNHGNRYTGYERLRVDANGDSLMILGDQLTLNALYTAEAMWLGGLGYSLPLGYSGLRGQVSYAHTAYELGRDYRDLDATGTADVLNAGASYPLIRSQRTNLNISAAYQYKNLHDKVGFTGSNEKKSSYSLPLALQFDHRDNGLGGGITFGSLVLTPGQLDLASGTTDLLNTEGSYQKVNLDVVRLQATALNGLMVYGRASGQWAGTNLDSSEGFSIGGMSGVRAYPSGEASGDTGWLAQLELRYQLGSLNPYVFYDMADVRANARSTAGSANSSTDLQGGGIGLRYGRNGWSLDAAAAWRNGSRAESDPRDHQPQWWAAVSYRF